jgi:hypothetical protein
MVSPVAHRQVLSSPFTLALDPMAEVQKAEWDTARNALTGPSFAWTNLLPAFTTNGSLRSGL